MGKKTVGELVLEVLHELLDAEQSRTYPDRRERLRKLNREVYERIQEMRADRGAPTDGD